ncbi:MAG: cyclic nucleotide-binding domain-containing protein [Anaerolineaceae bacterium]|nr:cyclic nucleotide-binding domain-containing protein [Anaerolineaceae bacterium]
MIVDRDDILEVVKMIYPFHRKEERYLQEIIDAGEIAEFHMGEMIYKEGEESEGFFLVVQGVVELRRDVEAKNQPIVKLIPGDFFGFEFFEKERKCRSTAMAAKDAVVLIFRQKELEALLPKFPWFQRGLQTLFESFRQARQVRLDWMGVDEVIHFISRRHNVFLFFGLLGPVIFLVASFVMLVFAALSGIVPLALSVVFGSIFLISLLVCGWVYLDWTNDYSIVTNQRVVFQEKVVLLYDSRQEAPMNAVLKVDTATSLLGRWLGYGNVMASTYAGLVILRSLNRPKEAAAIVQAESERSFVRRRLVEKKELDGIIRERLSIEQPEGWEINPKEITPEIKPGRLQVIMANMFRMRFEQGPKITYRMHWFILMVKTFIPATVLLSIFAAWGLRMINWIQILPAGIFTALAAILGLVAFGFWVYQFFDWHNDYYEVTPDQVIDVYKKPLGTEERQAAPIKNIQSVEFRRKGILGVILNFGTVYIRVGDAELTFDYVYNPAEIQRDLFYRIAERDYREKQEALVEEKIRLGDWIEAYHHIRQEGERAPDSSQETK